MESIAIISTTVEKKDDAEKLLDKLFEKKLIGCAQLSGPMSSYYRWNGKMTNSVEYKLQLKTTLQRREQVFDLLKKQHPYEIPEIICSRIDSVNHEYFEWLKRETQ